MGSTHLGLARLAALDHRPNSRLSCQLVVSPEMDGLVVHLPETQT